MCKCVPMKIIVHARITIIIKSKALKRLVLKCLSPIESFGNTVLFLVGVACEYDLVDDILSLSVNLPVVMFCWMGGKVLVAAVAKRIGVKWLKTCTFLGPSLEMRAMETLRIPFVVFEASLASPVISYSNPFTEEGIRLISFDLSHPLSFPISV